MPALRIGPPDTRIIGQHLPLIVLGIDDKAEQHQVVSQLLRKPLLKPSQIAVQPKTVVRIGTASVDKRQHYNLADELGKFNLLLVLIRELNTRYGVSDRERSHPHPWVGNILQEL